MNKWLYYGGTLLIYYLSVVGAMVFNDIGILFEFIGAVSASTFTFMYPGIAYLLAEKRFGSESTRSERKWMRISAYTYIILGMLCFILLATGDIIQMSGN